MVYFGFIKINNRSFIKKPYSLSNWSGHIHLSPYRELTDSLGREDPPTPALILNQHRAYFRWARFGFENTFCWEALAVTAAPLVEWSTLFLQGPVTLWGSASVPPLFIGWQTRVPWSRDQSSASGSSDVVATTWLCVIHTPSRLPST